MTPSTTRSCFLAPIPQIAEAAELLDGAVTAHLSGHAERADQLLRLANMPEIRAWLESIWGANSPHIQYRTVSNAPPVLPRAARVKARMPSAAEKAHLHTRDGYHCRFCGIPVIRKEVRQSIRTVYSEAVPWGRTNTTQHAAFQAMWAQYDHILPHARGGTNDLNNVVVTCTACNYGRMNYTLEEVGLSDPCTREPIQSTWDGLERFSAKVKTDQVYVVGPDGSRSNSFLYELVEKEDTPEMREAHRKKLIELGLTEEQAKMLS